MQNAIWNLNDSNFQIPRKVVWLEVEVFFPHIHLSANLSRSLSSASALCSTFELLLTSLGRCLKIFICHTFDCLQIITRQISRDPKDYWLLYLWLFRVALDLFGKISQDHHPECGTQLHKYCRNADQLKSIFALHHCWTDKGRKEHLQGVQNSASKRFKICSKMWMNLWQWFGPYVHQGSKGK